MISIRKASGGWDSGASQIARACWAQASGKSIYHKSEWYAARGWRLGATIHRLKTDYGWPIRTEYRGPENVAYYSLPEHVDRASLRFPKSAREVAEEWGAA